MFQTSEEIHKIASALYLASNFIYTGDMSFGFSTVHKIIIYLLYIIKFEYAYNLFLNTHYLFDKTSEEIHKLASVLYLASSFVCTGDTFSVI